MNDLRDLEVVAEFFSSAEVDNESPNFFELALSSTWLIIWTRIMHEIMAHDLGLMVAQLLPSLV